MDNPNMPFTDIQKMFEQMMGQLKLPGVDVNAILDARRKDIEAVTEANKRALEGMQELTRKQADILRQTMEGFRSSMQNMNPADAAGNMAKQGELAQKAFQTALSNMRELAETAQKSQAEAVSAITQRVQENMEQMKNMMQPKK